MTFPYQGGSTQQFHLCFYFKPENIGFDAQGEVKIFDFGLCKILSENIKATPAYGYNLTGRVGR